MSIVRDWLGEAAVVTKKRRLKDRRAYLHLFPMPTGKNHTIKKNAGVAHTVKFIPMMVKATLKTTEQFVDTMLAPNLKQTCANLWRWVYDHIQYTPDGDSEKVRAPHRTAIEGKGDCDCMTGFLDSCLEWVRRKTGWMFLIVNRITKYSGPGFQHIYPFVITPTGERIILDCVTEYFNYEEPYSEKQDHLMDLEYLNGIDGMELTEDARLFGDDDLGKIQILQKIKETVKKVTEKVSPVVKKAVHVTNAVNPATLLLRTGFIAAMKVNLMNVAGRMKWSYLSEEEAKKRGFDMPRYAKLRKLRDRMEKTFYGAGGKPENLKEAILTGKGNAGKEVSGFGVIPIYAMQPEGLTLRQIVGEDLYNRETGKLSGLGEPITAAAIGSATAAIAAIAAALKEIGVFKPGEPNTDNPDASGSTVDPAITEPITDSGSGDSTTADTTTYGTSDTESSNTGSAGSNAKPDEGPKFLSDPMGWVKANPGKTFIAAAVVATAVGYGIYRWRKGKSDAEAERNQPNPQRDRGYSRQQREQFQTIPISG